MIIIKEELKEKGYRMKFLKENSYDIVRLYINQIGIAIFSLVLYFAAAQAGDDGISLIISIVISVFATAFYMVLIYTATWDLGAKDRIRIDAGRMTEAKHKGLLLSTVANLPNLLFILLSLIGKGGYMLGLGSWLDTLFAFSNLILRFAAASYLGILRGIFAPFADSPDLYYLLQTFGFLILTLLPCIAAEIGYRFGSKNFRIFSSGSKNKE